MMKAILRTTILAGAAYGAYVLAKKYFPSEVASAVDSAKSLGNEAFDSAKSFANDSVKSMTDQGKSIAKEVRRAV